MDSEVRQKEWTILETERLIRKIEQCEGMPAKLILMRHFYEAGMRAGEIAMKELAESVAKEVGGQFWETHRLNTGLLKFIAKLNALPAAPEEKKP